MKTLLTLLVLTLTSITAHAQANCYPQVVATPQGLITVIVCPGGVAR